MNAKYKYIIVSTAFGAAKKHNAILEAQTNTAQFIRDDNGKPTVFGDKSTASYMLSSVYKALKETTYTRRNTRTRLDVGYHIVFISDGEDYTLHPDGSIDAIEVRGIQSDKIALQFYIKKIDD